MNGKLIGSILLIVGTAIGGGMLALPIATSQAGFIYSSLLLLACWCVMTISAFLILEVNLWLPPESNMISMARATLGRFGEIIAWITYLLLLYSLLAAYIAGGGDFFKNLLSLLHLNIPAGFSAFLFAGLFGYVVCMGIRSVDLVNRSLMFIKLATFILLVALVMPHVASTNFEKGQFHYLTASITVAITSFGFATIVPSLRHYFKDDINQLHRAILIGSLIPLICYILWDAAIMGVIPREGTNGLIAMLHSNRSTTDFVNSLSGMLNRDTITVFARVFTSICLATSFLGVALSLSHFLADGFRLNRIKSMRNNIIVYTSTFIPPLLIVLFYPGIFISALSYAGIYCVILLILLPVLMVWYGRYKKNISAKYRVFGGKPLLVLLLGISVSILIYSVISMIYPLGS